MAKSAELVNGQDKRRISCAAVAKGQSRRESPKMASRPFQNLREETLQNQKEIGQAL